MKRLRGVLVSGRGHRSVPDDMEAALNPSQQDATPHRSSSSSPVRANRFVRRFSSTSRARSISPRTPRVEGGRGWSSRMGRNAGSKGRVEILYSRAPTDDPQPHSEWYVEGAASPGTSAPSRQLQHEQRRGDVEVDIRRSHATVHTAAGGERRVDTSPSLTPEDELSVKPAVLAPSRGRRGIGPYPHGSEISGQIITRASSKNPSSESAVMGEASLDAQPTTPQVCAGRRASISLSPRALRVVFGLGTRESSTPTSSEEEEGRASPPHPAPQYRRRVSTSLSPSAIRAAMGFGRNRESIRDPRTTCQAPSPYPELGDEEKSSPSKSASHAGSAMRFDPKHRPAEESASPRQKPPMNVHVDIPFSHARSQRRGSVSLSPSYMRSAMRTSSSGFNRHERLTTADTDARPAAEPRLDDTVAPHSGVLENDESLSHKRRTGVSGSKGRLTRSRSVAFMGRAGFNMSPPSSPPSSPRSILGSGIGQRRRERAIGNGQDNEKSSDPTTRRLDRRGSFGLGLGLLLSDATSKGRGTMTGWAGKSSSSGVEGDGMGEEGGVSSVLSGGADCNVAEVSDGLRRRVAEFTTGKDVSILCGTWNVNAKKPDCDDPWWLHEWLCPNDESSPEGRRTKADRIGISESEGMNDVADFDGNGADTRYHRNTTANAGQMKDVYAIGLQELVDLNAVNVAIDTRSQKRSTEWGERILSFLNLAAHEADQLPGQRTPHPPAPASNAAAYTANQAALVDDMGGTEMSVCDDRTPADRDVWARLDAAHTLFDRTDTDVDRPDEKLNEDTLTAAAATTTARSSLNGINPTITRQVTAGARRVAEEIRDTGSGGDGRGEDGIPRIGKAFTLDGNAGREDSIRGGVADEGRDRAAGAKAPEDGSQQDQRRGRDSSYVMVAKEHLVGTWIAIYVRAAILPQILDVRTGTVSAGVMGVMGNKGGVAVRLRLGDDSLCFVCSHLAAHRDNVRARNDNYMKILREMTFTPSGAADWGVKLSQQQDSSPMSPTLSRMGRTISAANPTKRTSGRRLSTTSMGLSPHLSVGEGFPMRSRFRAGQVTTRSLSPPASPEHHHNKNLDTEQRLYGQRSRTSPGEGRENRRGGANSIDNGNVCRERRRSMSMSSVASCMGSTSLSRASAIGPRVNLAADTSPLSLMPCLGITVASRVAGEVSPSGVKQAATSDGEDDGTGNGDKRNAIDGGKHGGRAEGSTLSKGADSGGSTYNTDKGDNNDAKSTKKNYVQHHPVTVAKGANPSSMVDTRDTAIDTLDNRRMYSSKSSSEIGLNGDALAARPEPLVHNPRHQDSIGEDASAKLVSRKFVEEDKDHPAGDRPRRRSSWQGRQRANFSATAMSDSTAAEAVGHDRSPRRESGIFEESCRRAPVTSSNGTVLSYGNFASSSAAEGFSASVSSEHSSPSRLYPGGDSLPVSPPAAVSTVTLYPDATRSAGKAPLSTLIPERFDSLGIQDHDVVFWFGDLNYRICSTVASLDVLAHAVGLDLQFLLENDQLNNAREAGDAFDGFLEGNITFRPTYKYVAGTNEYDVRADKKFRAPAWCDRVLFRSGHSRVDGSVAVGSSEGAGADDSRKGINTGLVTQFGYRRSETPVCSDHKPVSASFRFGSRQIDFDAHKKILDEVIKAASGGVEDGVPEVDLLPF